VASQPLNISSPKQQNPTQTCHTTAYINQSQIVKTITDKAGQTSANITINKGANVASASSRPPSKALTNIVTKSISVQSYSREFTI
jgi:hypothetical protein